MKTKDEKTDTTVQEIGLIYKRNTEIKPVKITCSADIEPILRPLYDETQQIDLYEYSFAIYLNAANMVVGVQKISEGGTTSTVVDTKKVMVAALLQNATALIFSHNHPSGQLKPSEQDIKLTKKIKEASSLFDMTFLDHIIISSEAHYSFADNGLI
jgi:DNA repair protein RadC